MPVAQNTGVDEVIPAEVRPPLPWDAQPDQAPPCQPCRNAGGVSTAFTGDALAMGETAEGRACLRVSGLASPSPRPYEAPIRTALLMENEQRPAHLRHSGRRWRRGEATERAMPLMTVAVREGGARRRGVLSPTAAPDQVIERLCRAVDFVVPHTKLHRNGHKTTVGARSVDASILPPPRNKSPRSRHRSGIVQSFASRSHPRPDMFEPRVTRKGSVA